MLRHRWIFRALGLVSSIALAACSTATDTLPGPSQKVTFKLRNDSGAPIFVRQASYSPHNHWTSLSDADGAIVERAQPFCNTECGDVEARCAGDQPPTIVELGVGAEITEEWDGAAWAPDSATGCYNPTRPRAGRYRVSFCYGYGRSGVDLERASCVAQTFDFAPGAVVTQVVSEPGPQEVRFVLQNASASSVYVMENIACSIAPGWLSLSDGSGAVLSIETGVCGCQCGRPCAPCAASCVAPRTVEIPPGQTIEFKWDGFYNAVAADSSCSERRIAPNGPLAASFCHGLVVADAFGPILDPICQRVEFDPRVDGLVTAVVRD